MRDCHLQDSCRQSGSSNWSELATGRDQSALCGYYAAFLVRSTSQSLAERTPWLNRIGFWRLSCRIFEFDRATTASRDWGVSAVTSPREGARISDANFFSTLRRRLAKVLFVGFVIPLTIAARADELPPNSVEISFGETTVRLDSGLLLGVGGVAKSLLGSKRKFDMPVGSPAQVALPKQVLASFSPPCEAISSILMIHGAFPSRADNPLYAGLRPHKTNFEGISKLEAANGRPLLDLYQFDSDHLRDFWGDQIDFYKSGTLIRLNVQITRDLRVELGTSANECFFERGEIFVTQLRAFIVRVIKSRQ